MNDYMVHPIGKVRTSEEGTLIELEKEYIPALKGLEGFSHMNILWWFSCCDNEASRSVLTAGQPYKKGPAVMGTFATRSPERPNPIALTTAGIISLDKDRGIIQVTYMDCHDNTPILDIKPYTPALTGWKTPACLPGAHTGPAALRNRLYLSGKMNLTFRECFSH